MKTIAITIDEETLRRVDHVLSERRSAGKNRSDLARRALREFLERLDRLAEEERERAIFRKERKRLARQASSAIREQARP